MPPGPMVLVVRRYLVEKLAVKTRLLPAVTVRAVVVLPLSHPVNW